MINPKSALATIYRCSGIAHAQEAFARLVSQPYLTILVFHRVTDEIQPDGLTVGTRWFRGMCRLLQQGFRVAPLSEIFRLMKSRAVFPRRTIAITFDDCYRDNLLAARVLAEHHLPACFFIPTAYVGTDHVFEWDRKLKKMANLSWDDVWEMSRLGHEIGSHTVTHPNMAQVPESQARRELFDSKKCLEDKLSKPIRYFAYPFGGKEHFLTERLPLVHEAGYEGVLSAHGGFIHQNVDYPIVPREAPPYFHSLHHFELYLRGSLRWFHSLRRFSLS